MIARIGFWNRLAIVAAGLVVLIGPIWGMANMASSSQDSMTRWFKLCQDDAYAKMDADVKARRPLTYQAESDHCYKQMNEYPYYRMNWSDWSTGVGMALAFCAMVYGLIWSIVFTLRWIWAGRKQPI